MAPAVSVIVPVYNVEKYLRQCLDSIVNQTLKNIEIICVNDGSTDASAEILSQYAQKDKRITVINQSNQGVSVARNNAMKHANGEFLGFVDSDDWISENYFEELYNAAKKYDAEIAGCSFVRVYRWNRIKERLTINSERVIEDASEKFRILDLPRRCYLFNKLFNHKLIKRLGLEFPPEITLCEDVPFSTRAVYFSNKLVTVPAPMYYYRVAYDSITRGEQTDKKQSDRKAMRQDFIQFAREHNIKCAEKSFMRERVFHYIGGILVMKICIWDTIKKYYLFGGIKIWETRRF